MYHLPFTIGPFTIVRFTIFLLWFGGLPFWFCRFTLYCLVVYPLWCGWSSVGTCLGWNSVPAVNGNKLKWNHSFSRMGRMDTNQHFVWNHSMMTLPVGGVSKCNFANIMSCWAERSGVDYVQSDKMIGVLWFDTPSGFRWAWCLLISWAICLCIIRVHPSHLWKSVVSKIICEHLRLLRRLRSLDRSWGGLMSYLR